MIDACICTIGDEILIGQIIDTNSAFISSFLNQIGVRVSKIISIGDDYNEILSTLSSITNNYQVIIITGGLGPTKDDITKNALSSFYQSNGFHYDQIQLDYISEMCNRRGIPISQINKDQALVPDNCIVINNFNGTAPGLFFKKSTPERSLLFSLPGVPYEMKSLIGEVCNYITKEFTPEEKITHKTLATYGIAESALSDKLDEWENKIPNGIKLAYLPNPSTGIKLRLSKYGGEAESNLKAIEQCVYELKSILGELIYGEDEDTLQSIVSEKLRELKKTLSIAESCTGGRISSLITSIPHSSDIFTGGAVVYSNEAKIELLKINPDIISTFGAVSKECAAAMATGIRKRLDTHYGLSVTGIAGPTGGTDQKPVGTVWIAVSTPDFTITKRALFTGDRERNIIRFSSEALNFLRLNIR